MNIFKVLFEIFLIYLAYKFIVDFVIPIYRASKKVKGQMHDIQQKMEEQQRRYQQADNTTGQKPEKAAEKDYIDFEEVKD